MGCGARPEVSRHPSAGKKRIRRPDFQIRESGARNFKRKAHYLQASRTPEAGSQFSAVSVPRSPHRGTTTECSTQLSVTCAPDKGKLPFSGATAGPRSPQWKV